jgi:hypothetical protein
MDVRLGEFRRASPETGVAFVPSDSPKGQELLRASLHEHGP